MRDDDDLDETAAKYPQIGDFSLYEAIFNPVLQ